MSEIIWRAAMLPASLAILLSHAGCRSAQPTRPAATTVVARAPVISLGPGSALADAPAVVATPADGASAARAAERDPDLRLSSHQTLAAQDALPPGSPPIARQETPLTPPESSMELLPPVRNDSLSLRDALATGLMQNPDLVTARGTANVSAAAVGVAGTYPWNPFVQGEYFPNGSPFTPSALPGGQAGGSNYYVWLMQRFELGHQRQFREQSARAAYGQVSWNIRQAELNNLAQSERFFFTALYLRQVRDLAADTETLSERLREVVERRFTAGLATSMEIANARVAARQSRRQFQLADANYQSALWALRQQLGLSAAAPLQLNGDLSKYQWLPISDAFCSVSHTGGLSSEALAVELVEARPDVMAAGSGVSIARSNLNLAKAARVQDVQAGPIYQTADDGTRYLGFRMQRDFGVFNNGSALVSQRDAELRQQLLALDQLKRRATGESAAAIERYERARTIAADAARDGAQMQSREVEQVVAQFEAGKADIVNVLAIQNNLLQDLRASLDLFNEVAQAAAGVTQATGLPPESLLAPARPEQPPPNGTSSS